MKRKENRKEKRITIRFSQQELDMLKQLSENKSITISEYIREVVLNKKETSRKRKQNKELGLIYVELNRIGNNINQIAKALNTSLKYINNEKLLDSIEKASQHLNNIEKMFLLLIERVEKC